MATIGKILFGILLTGVGLAVGFVLASPPAEVEAVSHAGCGDGCASGAEAPPAPEVLAPQTLKSMGVVIGPAVKHHQEPRGQRHCGEQPHGQLVQLEETRGGRGGKGHDSRQGRRGFRRYAPLR